MDTATGLRVRTYGSAGPHVVVLQGGPAAAGSAEGLARSLADSFRVLEPWQRRSGGERLTVATHVADLHDVVLTRCADTRPALVGHSWGAMLALVYASIYSDNISAPVIVGCGTFDPESRARMKRTIEERIDDDLRGRLQGLTAQHLSRQQTRFAEHLLMRPTETYAAIDVAEGDTWSEHFDLRAHEETWQDMIRLQECGAYPNAFEAIALPVLMLHGSYDPHPGPMIRDSLRRYIPHLEYREFERCGHEPWSERYARDEFLRELRAWLLHHSSDNPPGPVI
jgi:pimeloyl-ACP methyl ester carboxylesterase